MHDWPEFSSGLNLRLPVIAAHAAERIAEFDIRVGSAATPAGTLSGGNQQKVILARELGREHKALIANQPTRGLDVGSIEFVHRRIVQQRDHGVAVVIVSSELDEIYALSDRIAVMYEGKITGFRDPDVPAAELGRLMAGGVDPTTEPAAPKEEFFVSEPDAAARKDPAKPTEKDRRRRSFRQILKETFLEANTFTVTALALVTATVLGGLLCAFTNAAVLNAPSAGSMIAQAWDVASGTYVALFEDSVFNLHAVAALFQQASLSAAIHDGALSAVFSPLSETAVQATPLILTGLAVALPYQAGLFNIGGQSQFIGGAILAAWLGYASSLAGGFVGGAAIGWLAGEIKARTGAHEVIVTIMLNYVMQYLLAYLLSSPSLLQAPDRRTRSRRRSSPTRACRCWPARTCGSTPAS